MSTATTARVAILGFWHVHARDFVRDAREAGAEIVAGWDADPAFGAAEAARLGIPFEPDLDALLARDDVDGVVVTTATALHRDVIPRALRAGKHVISEKVLAPTRAEAEAIAAVAEETGRALHVALVRLAFGSTRAILDELAAGTVGTPTHARVRVAHDGVVPAPESPGGWLPARFLDPAEAAGGALTDLGAHPLYLLRVFLGMPESVAAAYGHVAGAAVEDNAAVAFRYANGALGVAETGFVSAGPFTSVEINGTHGNLHLSPVDGVLRRRVGRGGAWEEIPVPEDGPVPFRQWLDLIPGGAGDPANLQAAIDLSALAEAANRAAASGRAVRLEELR